MNQFVLAFPLCVGKGDDFKITETVTVAADAKTVMVPGCTMIFNVVRHDAVPQLSDVFAEHQTLSDAEKSSLDGHKSMLFLVGTLRNADDLSMVNNAILKVLAAGALGVYMQQSGTAWTADAFREELGDAEFPMDPWINFVESTDLIYTLGLEAFSLPDLCVAKSLGNENDLRDALAFVADSLFIDGVESKSGTSVNTGDFGNAVLRQEVKSLFPKDAPEFNRQGTMRLVKV